jgi:hypothetical protein
MDASRKTSYARALPYRSPEEMTAQSNRLQDFSDKLAAQSAQLRRWTYVLAAAGAGVLVLAVVAVVVILILVRPPAPAPAGPAPGPAQASAPKKDGDTPVSKEGQETPSVPAKGDSVKNDDPPKAPAKKVLPSLPGEGKSVAPAKPAGVVTSPAQREAFLEALGGLSAAHLYQTYLNIGLLADGVESKAYTLDEAKSTLATVLDFMDQVEGKLTKLDRGGLEADDLEALDRIKATTNLLRLQAKTLLAFWTTSTQEQADQYQQARKAALAGLNKVLGLDSK